MLRRTLLGRGAVVLAAGIAGCVGASDDDPAPTSTEPPMEPTATPSPTPTPTAAPEPVESPADGMTPTDAATTSASTSPAASPADGSADRVVVVGPDGSLSFSPSSFTVDAGETVLWTWDSNNHNVRPSEAPAEADWAGTPGGDGDIYDTGYTYSYTFEVPGRYEYYCGPHRGLGMTGSFSVL